MNEEHKQLVKALVKPGYKILPELTLNDAHLLHMCMGVMGEIGELIDAVKKSIIYQKPLDLENVVEEFGDIEFYLEGLRQGLNIDREETINKNISKLNKRYSTGAYSNKQAVERADKVTK